MRAALTPSLVFALSIAPFVVAIGVRAEPVGQDTFYEGNVQRALSAHCGSCHTGEGAAAGLDLTTFAGILRGGSSGKVVVPGKPEQSLLVARLEGKGGMPQMPLGFKPLAPEKIRVIKAWIASGSRSTGGVAVHWAYVAPKLPALPRVGLRKWVRRPIDQFVLARLEREGLKPSAEASKETLVRRLYLDLNGLPPTPAEVDAFVADKRVDAYERLVDKLLASPHYGERMARPWLDLARYADSDGYEKDLNRTAWKFRDWVIEAFNRNLPYDQFTIEQLAGDMLPQPTLEQMVATGFHRNSMFNSEGGVDPGEAHFNVVLDRVNTTSTVWLGSTMACARCHDHKYDPFSQRDYYKMFAVFGNTEVVKQGDYTKGQESWTEPTIEVPTPEQASRRVVLERAVNTLEAGLKNPKAEVMAKFEAWIAQGATQAIWTVPLGTTAISKAGQELEQQPDLSFVAKGKTPANDDYTIRIAAPQEPVTGIRLEALPDASFPNNGPGRASSGNFILTKVELRSNTTVIPLAEARASFTQNGYDPQRTLGGDNENGWAIFNAYGQASELLLVPAAPVRGGSLELVLRFGSTQWPEHVIGRFRVSTTSRANPTVLPNLLKQSLTDPAKLAANRPALLAEFQRLLPETKSQAARLEALKKELGDLKAAIPNALVLRERAEPDLRASVHIRGEYLQKGETVEGGPPSVVSPRPAPKAFSRLDLAKWLVNRQNPLTARVQVNRLWELLFGRGIVETSEDFGTQGAPPSHPELLDWLALKYMDLGWDTKAMLKLIVTSSTYRQSSASTPEKNRKDPKNILLSRSPRYRLEAETVRDTMLTIGGLLSLKIGGPSVYPSQPPAIWNTPYNSQQWMTSAGPDKYRRGLYTFWKRSAPYPAFMAMDATSRETCTVRRIRTNTPLQALALLNDETSIEAAEGLAARMSEKPNLESALVYGFRACTGRRPDPTEVKILKDLHTKALRRLSAKPGTGPGPDTKTATYTIVANTLLNMDETISRN